MQNSSVIKPGDLFMWRYNRDKEYFVDLVLAMLPNDECLCLSLSSSNGRQDIIIDYVKFNLTLFHGREKIF